MTPTVTLPTGVADGQFYFRKTNDVYTFYVIICYILYKIFIFSSNFLRRYCLPCLLGGNATDLNALCMVGMYGECTFPAANRRTWNWLTYITESKITAGKDDNIYFGVKKYICTCIPRANQKCLLWQRHGYHIIEFNRRNWPFTKPAHP